KIEQQAFRAASIASSLLNFSRQRDGDYQALDISDMVTETLDLFQAHLRGRRIDLLRRTGQENLSANGNRGRLQQVLAREGYLITLAPDAETGLQALDQHEFDLIILDLMLPGLGGFEALKEIKRKDPDGVVVMITAYGSVESAVQGMRMGAHDYLIKPFKNEDVLRTLSTGLRHRRLLAENRSLRRALEGRARF